MNPAATVRWEPMTTVPPAIEEAIRPPHRWPTAGRATDRATGWWLGALLGRMLLVGGLLLLAFAAYQLWGTGRFESRAQEELSARLAERLRGPGETEVAPRHDPAAGVAAGGVVGGIDPVGPAEPADGEAGLGPFEPADAALIGGGPESARGPDHAAAGPGRHVEAVDAPTPVRPAGFVAPAPGEPFAALRIPAIGVDKTVVEGTSREALRAGPGHYRGTAVPGQAGNVAIAGHRTTYGAPFRDLDELEPGDEIVLETPDGVFTYLVEDQAIGDEEPIGHRIVSPDRVEVIADRGDHRVTLTACHPLYSARERIVVTATLVDPPPTPPPTGATMEPAEWIAGPATAVATVAVPAPEPTDPTAAPGLDERAGHLAGEPDDHAVDDLGWQREHLAPTAGWAAITAGIAAGAVVLGRLWRRRPAYVMAAPSFTLALVTAFEHLDRLIPAA